MQYFPNMINAMPSESAEFRRVLWTGLYSQVVLMTVPVGGDIGDEVRLISSTARFHVYYRVCMELFEKTRGKYSGWLTKAILIGPHG